MFAHLYNFSAMSKLFVQKRRRGGGLVGKRTNRLPGRQHWQMGLKSQVNQKSHAESLRYLQKNNPRVLHSQNEMKTRTNNPKVYMEAQKSQN